MKRILLSLAAGVGALCAMAQASSVDFQETNSDGVLLSYHITDATNNYVELTTSHFSGGSYEYQPQFTALGLMHLTIPSTVTHGGTTYAVKAIGVDALRGNMMPVTRITLSEGITEIKRYAMAAMYQIEQVDFPTTLTTLADNGLVWSGAWVYNNTGREVHFDFSQTQITYLPNLGAGAMSTVTFPATLQDIGGFRFDFFGSAGIMHELTIPDHVTRIGMLDFTNSTNLKKITLESATPPTVYNSTSGSANADAIFYTPIDATKAYETATGWSSFDGQYREQTVTGASGYTTFYLENENFVVPTGCTAYIITGATQPAGWTEGDPYNATITSFAAGSVLPAQTPFILYSGSAGTKTVTYEANSSAAEVSVVGNLMVGTATDAVITAAAGEKLYVFSGTGNGTLGAGFYTQGNRAGGSISLKAHRAGLKLPASAAPAKGLRIDFSQATPYDGTTTGIAAVTPKAEGSTNETYDLTGRRVTSATKGIYIINGKKIIR